MLTGTDLQNRRVSGAVAATVSGIKPGTVRKMQHDGDVGPTPLDMVDALNLSVAARLAQLGLPLVKAAGIARAVTYEDWRRIVLGSDPVRFHLIAGVGADGVLQVAVADDSELATLPVRPSICVDLTAVGREVFARLITLQRGEAP